LYLSDLEEYLSKNSVNHLEFLNENCIQHIGMYLKLFLLLYDDDTVIFAESAEDLQAALNIFEEYCSEWKLFINVSKTKIVVFSKRKYNNKKDFLLNNEEVEAKDSYTYLELLFNYNGNLCQGRKKLVDQAQKALYALYIKIYNLGIPVD
jgi:hypothetical protein